ncbi:hypothetical protein C8A01DRAFT_35468 [Parachaetomium inaequale]|uniref:Extracellular membrane protein CFEM domain-containing protein n=1 Tax=Parachaetomium inaequale TaxID=2588326 RepID=A0AAN6SSJ0_9PEZI|nr:hypothetical protein C8A01DRAFT_35468 [Parachaetomium inaequale]
MVLASYVRLALLGAALFVSPAQATFQFPSCVESCVVSSGCKTNNARCMCTAARELLLDSVISCLFFSCKDDLRNFEDAFLDPIEQGCEDSNRDIPRSKLRAAESLATSYIGKLPSPTTFKSTTVEVTHTPKPTTKPSPATTAEAPSSSSTTTTTTTTTTTEEGEPTPSSSSAAERGAEESTSTAATQSAATPSQSPTSDDSGSSGGFAANPFGSPSGSAGSAIQPLLVLLSLPLAVSMLALR